MSERNVHDPQDPGSELPVEGAVDTLGGTGSTPGSRPGSIHLFPFLASGVELATGLFNRLESRFVGIRDNKRIGNLVVAAGAGTTSLLTALLNEAEDAAELLQAVVSGQALQRSDVKSYAAWVKSNIDRIINRNLGSIRESAEDLEEFGQAILSRIDAVKVPLDRLGVLYLAYNYATAAMQAIQVVPSPKGVNGPVVLLSSAALAEVAGAYDIDVPVSNYDLFSVGVYIDAAAGDTYQIDLLARIDDQAAGDWINVNGMFTVGGTALGAAADPCALLACVSMRRQYRELRVRRTKVNNNGNAAARIWFMEGR